MPIPVTYEGAKAEVERLVERFARLSAQNRKHYNEAATRQEFILPLFGALGWNVAHAREVSPEEKVSRGFVDFAFRLNDVPRFFLETKKIPADLDDPRWARQVINYAWLKGVTWAVLSDFEALKVFNAEWQETIPARAVFKDLHWGQYLDRFDDLWLLSRPAMEEGLLDRAAEAVGKKAKKTPVSRLLFADLTEWRRELFRTLRPYNPLWSVEQVDEAVQRILDRLIFIRTCEDRGIEPYRLQPLLREWRDQGRKKDLLRELNALFREFDAAYDSRLFAPHLCEELTSEPAPFEHIVAGLYDVPGGYGQYDFNAIDADVLGTIYEQYLGHRAQDPEGQQVVDRRARRKAQGIYYTPQFVVRYIVGQTLGRFLQEHDYEQARQVKVLDMACGSGSFLIEAFDVLDRYLAEVRGQQTPLPRRAGERPGEGVASDAHDLARRMEILSGNLYGVDLDAQAVEIARLNLLLKAVNQRGHLPMLDNVRQGNSLISGAPAELEAAFGPAWRDKHPLNWAEEFPQICTPPPPCGGGDRGGGFDVIVGNPPYIRAERMAKDERLYWQESGLFETVYGRFDVFALFMEVAIRLLREGGRLGFIIPYAILSQNYGTKLRESILDTCCIEYIVDLSKFKVFQEASVSTCILILRKVMDKSAREKNSAIVVRQDDYSTGINLTEGNSYPIPQAIFRETPFSSFRLELSEPVLRVIGKIDAQSLKLGDVCYVITGAVLHDPQTGASKERLIHVQEAPGLKSYIEAKEVARYVPPASSRFLDYAPHEVHRAKFPELFENDKLMICRIASKVMATYDNQRLYTDHTLDLAVRKDRLQQVKGRDLKISAKEATLARQYDLLYLLGLINSRVATFYLQMILGMAIEINPETARRLPIRRIAFDDPADAARHDRMVAMVEEMLHLQQEHAQAKAAKEDRRHDLARQIERLDAQIDALVYELYGLTEGEIAVVEGLDRG